METWKDIGLSWTHVSSLNLFRESKKKKKTKGGKRRVAEGGRKGKSNDKRRQSFSPFFFSKETSRWWVIVYGKTVFGSILYEVQLTNPEIFDTLNCSTRKDVLTSHRVYPKIQCCGFPFTKLVELYNLLNKPYKNNLWVTTLLHLRKKVLIVFFSLQVSYKTSIWTGLSWNSLYS